MKILITGGCGFVGANIALFLNSKGYKIESLDNLSRKGSNYNLNILKQNKIKNYKIDISNYKKLSKLPKYDLVIDCCAEAAVEVSRKNIDKVINTNLIGTLNVLKKVKQDSSKILFLSSSRIYPINESNKLIKSNLIKKKIIQKKMFGEKDNIQGAKTIYGLTKLTSEMLIEEFAYAFKIKYLINRCGVISGPLQFGKQDQGFVSLWLWRHIKKKKINYIGYGGNGFQIRDVLHINDLCNLIHQQILNFNKINNKKFNVGGGRKSYTSLRELTKICQKLTGNKIKISSTKKTSIYDIPYYISDNTKIKRTYKWIPKNDIFDIVTDTYNWLNKNKKDLKRYL